MACALRTSLALLLILFAGCSNAAPTTPPFTPWIALASFAENGRQDAAS